MLGTSVAAILSATILAATVAADNRIVFHSFSPIFQGRIDPIISPGAVSQHVHHVMGASGFNPTYDAEHQRQSNCTNLNVQADKSNYWQPSIYRVLNNGSYMGMQTGTRIYYFMSNVNTPFPYDHRMVAGDPYRKTYNASSESDQWQYYYCGGSEYGVEQTNTLPTTPCGWLISKVFYPSCWNGQPYNETDPHAHMAYAIGGFLGTECPDGYPYRFPDILLESFFFGADQPETNLNQSQYVLANGDTTGYGLHGDFANGWDPDVFNEMITTCQTTPLPEPANEACAALAPTYNDTIAGTCLYQGLEPAEYIGMQWPLDYLPGCNLDWDLGNKPMCNPKVYKGDPGWTEPQPDNKWQYSRYPARKRMLERALEDFFNF